MELLKAENGYPFVVLDGFDEDDVIEKILPALKEKEGIDVNGFWFCHYGFKYRKTFEAFMTEQGFVEHKNCPMRKIICGATMILPLWSKKDVPLDPCVEGMTVVTTVK